MQGASNPSIESAVATMQNVINGGRKVREQQKKSMKQPLKEAIIVSKIDEICNKNEELCSRNEELCTKNEELCIKND